MWKFSPHLDSIHIPGNLDSIRNSGPLVKKKKGTCVILSKLLTNLLLLTDLLFNNLIKTINYRDIRTRVKNKIITTFQKMDFFGYQTNINWMLNLSLNRAKNLYRHLSVYWFYKANLTDEVRNNIVPNGGVFTDSMNRQVMRQINKYVVLEYNIDIINKFVSASESESDRNLGSIITLMAMGEICAECAMANSWLM